MSSRAPNIVATSVTIIIGWMAKAKVFTSSCTVSGTMSAKRPIATAYETTMARMRRSSPIRRLKREDRPRGGLRWSAGRRCHSRDGSSGATVGAVWAIAQLLSRLRGCGACSRERRWGLNRRRGSIQHDSPVDMRRQVRIVRDEMTDQGSSLLHRRRRIVSRVAGCILENPFEDKEFGAPGSPVPPECARYAWGEDFAGGSYLGFQAVREGIDFFFEFRKAQRPPHVAVGGCSRAPARCSPRACPRTATVGVQDESLNRLTESRLRWRRSTPFVADDAGGRGLKPAQDSRQRRLRHRRIRVDTDLFPGVISRLKFSKIAGPQLAQT